MIYKMKSDLETTWSRKLGKFERERGEEQMGKEYIDGEEEPNEREKK